MKVINHFKNKKKEFLIAFFIFAGLLVRLFYAPQFVVESGDIRLYADWGEKLIIYKPINFYNYPAWIYAPPNYPPLLSLIYGVAFWMSERKYYLAQLHNLIRIPPAIIIKFFYTHGYFVLLKLPGILADLGVSLLIYKFILEISKKTKAATLGLLFYLFNPVSIFLSSVWGQTDSLIAFMGLLSFYALYRGKIVLSLPLLFTSLYIKPNWGVFIPLYIFLLIVAKPKLGKLITGALLIFLIFITTTAIFSRDIMDFSYWLFTQRILPTATIAHKASISAFNLYTVFLRMDFHPDNILLLGAIPLNIFGYASFVLVNIIVIIFLSRRKLKLENLIFSLFIIGFGAYLFLTNMLERYFFAAFIPMIILMFSRPKLFVYGVLINIAVFANVFYAFFRRSKQVLAELFASLNFLPVRLFSAMNVLSFFLFLRSYGFSLKESFLLKLKRG